MLELCCLAALAAQAPDPAPLTYADTRARAAATYPGLRAARTGVLAARARVAGARAWDDPMLDVSVWNLPLNQVEGALMPGMSASERATTFLMGPDMFPLMVMASQTFPFPGKRGARADEAQARAEEAEAMVEASRADLDRAVAYALADLHAGQEALRTVNGTLALMDTMVAIADGRVQSGLGRQADALATRAERETLLKDQLDLRQQQEVARARLAALLGVTPSAIGPVWESVRHVELPPRETLLQRALAARPELRAARAQVAAAVARARQERLAALPDVTAKVGYMVQTGGVPMLVSHGPLGALLGPADMVTVGVSVPLPVFYPFKQARSLEAARYDERRAAESADALIRVIQSEVDEASAAIRHAHDHVTLHEETLIPLSSSTVEATRAAYISGSVDVLALITAVRQMRSHHLERLTYEALYVRRLADLQRATGMELLAFDPSSPGGHP
ncbi:MAG: TolC family protein [Deltaproteobacteria bacterium]|nr:TolC family protein [Deltaproteobacteria bacterium]